jgi:hypothetical protein
MNNAELASESQGERVPAGEIELVAQEIPLDDPNSRFRFDPFEKQFVATRGAIGDFGVTVIHGCTRVLQAKVKEHDGLDYLQIFRIGPEKKKLWFIEDGQAITALLPDEY